MKTLTLFFHRDAGHGWLAAKRSLLLRLGLLQKVTPYSYERGGTVYLEEDLDAGLLISHLKKTGQDYVVTIGKHFDRSPIRSYRGFTLRPGERMAA